MFLPCRGLILLGFPWSLPLSIFLIFRHGYRGAGGATFVRWQLRRHQLGPRREGGAAVATWGECNDLGNVAWKCPASLPKSLQVPVFQAIFSWNYKWFLFKTGPKTGRQKVNTDTHTHRQNRADPEQLRDHVLDSQNADTVRKCLKNMLWKWLLNPASIPVKEHLRLASVVALSSSGACGAIKSLQ